MVKKPVCPTIYPQLESLPMVRETVVQSQVQSYQRHKNWYLMPPCLTLSIIRSASRVKWSNPGNGVAPSPTPQCSSYWKGSLRLQSTILLTYNHETYGMYRLENLVTWTLEFFVNSHFFTESGGLIGVLLWIFQLPELLLFWDHY